MRSGTSFHLSYSSGRRRRGIVVEKGYGSGMAIDESEYSAASSRLVFRDRVDFLAQEAVMQVRCMDEADLALLRPGTILLTMLHYATRPDRMRRLSALELMRPEATLVSMLHFPTRVERLDGG